MTAGTTVNTSRHFAAFLRENRLRDGVTQEELADRIGKSRKWVSGVENGTLMPTLPAVLDAAQALGFSLLLVKDNASDSALLDELLGGL